MDFQALWAAPSSRRSTQGRGINGLEGTKHKRAVWIWSLISFLLLSLGLFSLNFSTEALLWAETSTVGSSGVSWWLTASTAECSWGRRLPACPLGSALHFAPQGHRDHTLGLQESQLTGSGDCGPCGAGLDLPLALTVLPSASPVGAQAQGCPAAVFGGG